MKQLLLILAIVFSHQTAQAALCTYQNATVNLPTTIQSTTDIKSGQMISTTWHEIATPAALTCTSASYLPTGIERLESVIRSTTTTSNSGMTFNQDGVSYIVFNTGDPKVGVIAEVADNTNYVPLTTDYQVIYSRAIQTGGFGFTLGSRVRVRLVALSPLPIGPYTFTGTTTLIWHGLRTEDGIIGRSGTAVSTTTINTKNTACMLDLPPTIPLTKVTIAQLSGTIDDVLGTNFKITVSCKELNMSYKINYVMTDAYNPANNSNILSLSGESGQASGVGLKILDEGTVVTYGAAGSTSALRSFGTMAPTGGSITKNMTVRYTRTAPTVGVGKIRAGATITLSYN